MSGTLLGSSALTPYQTITFNEVPVSWLVPGTYVEVRPNYADQGIATFPARALVIGQMIATGPNAGTATPGQVYPITRSDQPPALFGRGSIASSMALAFLKANSTSPLYVLALADATGGAAATGTLTVGGAVTQNGTAPLYIGGTAAPTSLLAGDASAAAATKIAAAINLNTTLPVTAASAASVVTLTAKNQGVVGNSIDLRLFLNPADVLPPGITVAVAPMAGGTGTPTIASAIADISGQWFTDIVIPWSDAASLTALAAELATRYTALGMMDAQGYVSLTGTYGTFLTLGLTENSQYLTIMPMQNMPTLPWVTASVTGAVAIFNLTNDPARQLRGKALPGVVAPAPVDRFNQAEREAMLSEGLSTYEVLQDGTVVIERLITAYQTTNLGVPDQSWLDIMKPKVLTRIRYDWKTYNDTVYAGCKLAPDGSIAAQYDPTIATPRRIANAWAGRSRLYEQAGWIENSAQTAAASVFEIDPNDGNRLNSQLQINIIGNLIVQGVALEFTA